MTRRPIIFNRPPMTDPDEIAASQKLAAEIGAHHDAGLPGPFLSPVTRSTRIQDPAPVEPPPVNLVAFDDPGDPSTLDEIVTDGGCHLERLDDDEWFLSCQRADGSEVCVYFTGRVTQIEEREA